MLSTTDIEYLQRVFNPSGWGCSRHCSYCYAKSFAKLKRSKCPQCNAFVPHQHPERLYDPLRTKHPYRIGVDFMSDLFAPWVSEEWQKRVIGVTEQCEGKAYPPHTFIFLTKSPENLAKFNPWPSNTWVGCTITGAESPAHQQEMMDSLCQVEAKVRWVSWEPALGPLRVNLSRIDWVVFGAQSGPHALRPNLFWVTHLPANHPIWFKNNLPDEWFTIPRRQELPTITGTIGLRRPLPPFFIDDGGDKSSPIKGEGKNP